MLRMATKTPATKAVAKKTTVTKKTVTKAPVKAPAKAVAKAPAKAPTKAVAKAPAKTVAKAPAKAPAKAVAKAPAKAWTFISKTEKKIKGTNQVERFIKLKNNIDKKVVVLPYQEAAVQIYKGKCVGASASMNKQTGRWQIRTDK